MAKETVIIAVGSKHDADLKMAIVRYETRLQKTMPLRWVLLPYSAREGDEARRDESVRILEKVKNDDYVILCDERGTQLSSEALAAKLQQVSAHKRVVLVIGGAYGVDSSVHMRADFVWSLSLLVFPHQLVRLILAEQLYRAQMIATSHPYHHQ
jgi:23S rRNA (pseudouridine1915-N3)-methyltransferase